MKSAIISVLALSVLVTFANPTLGQQYEIIYPNSLMAIAEQPLPQSVYLSQQNILRIKAEFFLKNQPAAPPLVTQATGFIEKSSGYIVSARHLFVETVMNLAERNGEPFSINKDGILREVNYDYRFFAVLDTATTRTQYPLEVVAMGPLDTYLDVILFRPLKKISVKGLTLSSNVKPGDKVYASGFTTQRTHYHKANGEVVWITIDESKFTSDHVILVPIHNNTITLAGVKKLYRLAKPSQVGFSGGPVFNNTGQVIGIMIETDTLFSFVISSEDINVVIKSIK